MANPEHVAKLLEGVEAWNNWRKGNEDAFVDLSKLNLSGRDLSGVNFTSVTLYGSVLINANLKGADFHNADLTLAILAGANLEGADFFGATLNRVMFHDANFAGARFAFTSFADIDFRSVKGLDSTFHSAPSTIGVDSIYLSKGKIPERFLTRCGLPKEFVDYIPALLGAASPIEFYSVFISYSSKDQEFVERLYSDLQNKKVRCWYAPEDLKTGDKFRTRIDESIRLHDKLLLVLSRDSVSSNWVEKEVETAMEKEAQQKRTMLFPVRLDDSVMRSEIGWPADVRRTRHIADFTNWKNHDEYLKAFNRLLRDLQA